MGDGKQFMPKGRGLLALHANAGITFDLERHPPDKPTARGRRGFRPESEWPIVSRLQPNAVGTADIWVLVDGQVKYQARETHGQGRHG